MQKEVDTLASRISALLAATCDLGADRRVQLINDGCGPFSNLSAQDTTVRYLFPSLWTSHMLQVTNSALNLNQIWFFQPGAYIGSGLDTDRVNINRVVKVLYRPSSELPSADTTQLALPSPVQHILCSLLQERHDRLPGPLAGAMGWRASWL